MPAPSEKFGETDWNESSARLIKNGAIPIIGKAVPNADAQFISAKLVGDHPTGIQVGIFEEDGVKKITLSADGSASVTDSSVPLKIRITYGQGGKTSYDETTIFVTVVSASPP